ncbi:type II secretion system F family protein [Celerinatantimonas sp. MCCC 1A17872]|uniref:type II secretion system F family protein n=1 Tax=Celerinatantimonas sp. MCCC 1A17872 TaxID=3177514 RepID=UPI0038CBF9E4
MGTFSLFIIVTSASLILAVLVTLSLRAFARERKLKNFMGRKNHDYTWKDTVLKISRNVVRINQQELSQKLIAAGFYEERYVHFYFPIKYGFFLISTVLVIIYHHVLDLSYFNMIAVIAVLMIFFIIAPDIYLEQRKKQLTKKISQNLPYLIDLLGVCVQTGMTIEAAFIYLTKEVANFDKDLAYMLKKTTDRSHIVGLAKSLDELYERVPSSEMRSFVHTINQSLHYGTSIYSILLTLAKDIREIQMLSLEEKVGKLSAKMSIPLILFIMLPIVILIAAPGVMRLFYHGFH